MNDHQDLEKIVTEAISRPGGCTLRGIIREAQDKELFAGFGQFDRIFVSLEMLLPSLITSGRVTARRTPSGVRFRQREVSV